MLAVCEDAGLAAAAAAGRLSLPQLLQWSAVCGCGLDTVPVPGPRLGGGAWGAVYRSAEPHAPPEAPSSALSAAATLDAPAVADNSGDDEGGDGEGGGAAAYNEALLEAFTGVALDAAALAARLRKPLAVRLLPLPGAAPGGDAAFEDNPYLIASKVLPLS